MDGLRYYLIFDCIENHFKIGCLEEGMDATEDRRNHGRIRYSFVDDSIENLFEKGSLEEAIGHAKEERNMTIMSWTRPMR